MECSKLCFGICVCCCTDQRCPCSQKSQKNRDKYPYVEYYEPSRAIDVADMPEAQHKGVPVKKIFTFPQGCEKFHQHSRLRAKTFSNDMSLMPVTHQPSIQGIDETLYISGKGRTLGTLSELPSYTPSHSPEPPPFTPPILVPTSRDISPDYIDEEPSVQFSLYYDIQKRELIVTLYRALNIPHTEIRGSADFYVSVFILPNHDTVHQSSISIKTTSPVFNQEFKFESIVSEELREQVLVFQLFSHDKFGRDHLVGSVTILLSEADLFGVITVKKVGEGKELLKKFATGDLLLSLCYLPQTPAIHGIVLKATNLPRIHKWGLADPYVKVYLLHKQKRMSKWKSTTKKSTLAPIFNETFEFDIVGMDPKDISIEVLVMDHDTFRRNDVIGFLRIGPNVPNELGVSHYQEILCDPLHPISHWHQLTPHSQVKKRKRHKSNTM